MSVEDEKFEQVRKEISARLRGICSNMTDHDFDIMVRSIAEKQLRAEKAPMWKRTEP